LIYNKKKAHVPANTQKTQKNYFSGNPLVSSIAFEPPLLLFVSRCLDETPSNIIKMQFFIKKFQFSHLFLFTIIFFIAVRKERKKLKGKTMIEGVGGT